jgi:hypothetical protein
MKQFEIKITKSTRYVDFENDNEKVGNIGENLQTMLVFSFTDEFVDGQARLEYIINGESQYVFMEKVGETYQTPVTSQLAQCGSVDLQLVITEGTDENEIPKFKSNVFYLPFGKSINAEIEQPEEYEEWIDVANTKLNEVDNLDIDMQDNVVTITRKDGTQYSENVKGDAYEITKEDYKEIGYQVQSDIQPILDETTEKVNTAISISKGANQAIDYLDYANMVTNFNAFEKEKFSTGQQVMIKQLNVPDMWIYQLTNEYKYYTYSSDEEIIELSASNNGLHVGYYILSQLETQKVDLTDYQKRSELQERPILITQENGNTETVKLVTYK